MKKVTFFLKPKPPTEKIDLQKKLFKYNSSALLFIIIEVPTYAHHH